MPTVDLTDEEFKAVQASVRRVFHGLRVYRPAVEDLLAGRDADGIEQFFLPPELWRASKESDPRKAGLAMEWLADLGRLEALARKFNVE